MDSVVDSYVTILMEYQNEYESPRFSLTYIDNDDIPELVLYSDYYGAGTPVTVYSFYNGSTVEVGKFGTYSELLYGYKSSLIVHANLKYGEHYIVYSLENGVATEIGFYDSMPRMWYGGEDDENYYDEDRDVYYLGGHEVTKDDFLQSSVFLVNNEEVAEDQYLQALNSAIAGNSIFLAGTGEEITDSSIESFASDYLPFVEIGEQVSVPYNEE